jgi:glycosyltransferase involved in cell wall biosynthesis
MTRGPHAGAARRHAWHVITCGYPPSVGGVASYSRAIAEGLAAHGAEVHAWCPGDRSASGGAVHVHAAPDRWSLADLPRVGRELGAYATPRSLFVQWVPHGYGYKSLNLPFACWIALRAWRGDRVEVMVHEPWLAFEWSSARQSAAALVHRLMMALLLAGARRAWVSIPAWQSMLRRMARRTEVAWLPIPALLPVVADPAGVRVVRTTLAPRNGPVVGHFGTYGRLVTDLLGPAMEAILEADSGVAVALLGHGSDSYRADFVHAHPRWASRVAATGTLDERRLSLHLQACDVLMQPYPDGVSARRTTTTSLLAHACAVVTTRGPLTEGLWRESGGVDVVAPHARDLSAAVLRLLADAPARAVLGRSAQELHQRVFGLERTIAALLEPIHEPAAEEAALLGRSQVR